MWTQRISTPPAPGDGRRCRLLRALAWTLIVSSVAAQATWGWAMNRQGTEWVPEAVRVVLQAVDTRVMADRPETPIQERAQP